MTETDAAKKPATGGLAARRAAVSLVRGCLEDGAMLDEGGLGPDLAPADRARALGLARATMRWLGPADAVLAKFMRRPPAPAAQAILRVAAVELLALGEAPHGVVDAAVRLTKSDRKTAKISGLANAVLRRVADEGPAIWAGLDSARIATPDWFWRALRADWGKAGARGIAEGHLLAPPVDLTPRSGDPAALAALVGGERTPSGSVRLARPGKLSGLPGYAEGAWWAQDAAAAIPARLAGAGDGRRALDLCAAPGGKTMQLAAAGWRVTAVDASQARMARVRENLERTGLEAALVVGDALDPVEGAPFDLVLLDAPCTATGTVRRHPELPHIRDGAGLEAAVALQAMMLEAAWRAVAPGGVLIYCVCSLQKAEGEAQIAAFLQEHEDAEKIPPSEDEVGDPVFITPRGDFRARPDHWAETGGVDGFFAARLRRAP